MFSCYKVYKDPENKIKDIFQCDYCETIVYPPSEVDDKYREYLIQSYKESANDENVVERGSLEQLLQNYDVALKERDEFLKKEEYYQSKRPPVKKRLTLVEKNDLKEETEKKFKNMTAEEAKSLLYDVKYKLSNSALSQAAFISCCEEKKILEKIIEERQEVA